MGGSGAKNRRKQQRQQQQGETTQAAVTSGDSRSRKRNPAEKKPFAHKISQSGESRASGDRRGSSKTSSPRGINNQKPHKKKDKTFKKPKHLKRKLESADDEAVKEKLLQEIQSFQAKKKTRLGTQKPSRRAKLLQAAAAAADENAHPEAEEDFPRSSKKDPASKVAEKRPITEEEANPKQRPALADEAQDKSSSISSSSSDDSSSSASSENDSDISSDEEDDDKEKEPTRSETPPTTRTRGRRRRGRKNTSQQVEETQHQEQEKEQEEKVAADDNKQKSNNPQRYCVGRKPVTDFQVGQSYPGKVVYMKPFGVFLDIGCHSDAFCHISRCSDDYVERPEDLFQEGDVVPAVRIVEVDRKTKRLTVSLQTQARRADENKSIQARQERKQKLQQKKKTKHSKTGHSNAWTAEDKQSFNQHSSSFKTHIKFDNDDNPSDHSKSTKKNSNDNTTLAPEKTTPPSSTDPASSMPESEMTPAELKRARKIARRAARRAQQA